MRFVEKPDSRTAERLILDGAMWNGGAFAFKLGYLADIVDRYIHTETFAELRSRYVELPQISFDYEVVEKQHLWWFFLMVENGKIWVHGTV